MKAIKRERAFGITTPCNDIKRLRSYPYDLDLNNRLLYYAGEITILKGRTKVTPEYHAHVHRLYAACAIEDKPYAREFYAKLSVPRETDSEFRYRIKFWIRYCWLACFAADLYDEQLLVDDPPHSHEGSFKSWFWESELKGSPVSCADSPATQLMRVEKSVRRERVKRVTFKK